MTSYYKTYVNDFASADGGEGLLAILVLKTPTGLHSNLEQPCAHPWTKEGVTFFTDNEHPQQCGLMRYREGHEIPPHTHIAYERTIRGTSEVLFILKGCVRVDFYNSRNQFIQSSYLTEGEIVVLIGGGHGFTVIKDCEMLEVKQGPYVADRDKIRFNDVAELKSTYPSKGN